MLETLNRRRQLANSDVPVRIRWDRIGSLILGTCALLVTGGIFWWMLYLLSEL